VTTAARQALYQLARELVAAQGQAARVALRFTAAMLGSTLASQIHGGDSPAIDPVILEAIGALDVHAGKVAHVLKSQTVMMMAAMLVSPRRSDLARRITEAMGAGEIEARSGCSCVECRAKLGDAGKVAEAAVEASTARARGGP
jgi:hypothetical protein